MTMSFQMPISARKRKAARFVSKVHNQIQSAFTEAAHEGMTQRKLAEILEVDKSVLHRRLTGSTNLTLRSLADLAWALDADIDFTLKRKSRDPKKNHFSEQKHGASGVNSVHTNGLKSFVIQSSTGNFEPRASAVQGNSGVIRSSETSR